LDERRKSVFDAILPSGYKAVSIGSVTSFDDLGTFQPMEEGQEEGSRMLAELTFQHRPADFDYLAAALNQRCLETGVTSWPEHQNIAFADPAQPVIYICWQKGFVWWVWILGLLGSLILPPLIMAGLWLILPESLKDMIEAVTYIGILGVAMYLMSGMTRGMATSEEAK
jgi:hypothetical protein